MIQQTTYEAPQCAIILLYRENLLVNDSTQGWASAENATPSDGEWE